MKNDSIAFHGNLQQLLEKVESGEMIPKLQASHAPMCKFFTAYYVINGIRHVVPLVHGPTGCPLYMSDFRSEKGSQKRFTLSVPAGS